MAISPDHNTAEGSPPFLGSELKKASSFDGPSPHRPHGQLQHFSQSIWGLSWSFLFMNIASCIVFGCSPIFMNQFLGIDKKSVSIIEGTVEGFALIVRAVIGLISDAVGKRKIFIVTGYAIVAFSRFILPVGAAPAAIGARLMEKLGNGLQASPREAFISDISSPSMLGRSYGINKAMGMAGSFFGALVMLIAAWHYSRTSFPVYTFLWIAAGMTIFSVAILKCSVKDPKNQGTPLKRAISLKQKIKEIYLEIGEFSGMFWKVLSIITIIKLGYFSGAFLMNYLSQSDATFLGRPLAGNSPLSNGVFLVVQNLACTLLTYPLGRLSDAVDRRWAVTIGFFLMIASLLVFSFANVLAPNSFYIGIILYGLQMSMQGALMAFLATTMPSNLHGTGFGLFFLFSGVSIVFTNQVIMNFLVRGSNMRPAFLFIAACVAVALVFLWRLGTIKKPMSKQISH